MKIRVLTALMTLVLAGPAYAQNVPLLEVSGGYSHLRTGLEMDGELADIGVTGNPFSGANGWLASVTGNLTPAIGITGEVGRGSASTSVTQDGVPFSVSTVFLSVMGGPRFAVRSNPAVTPWGHVLIGITRPSASVSAQGFDVSVPIGTYFALQPGGGVDIWVSPNVGIRAGADWRRVFDEAEGVNQFRIQAGVVVGVGSL